MAWKDRARLEVSVIRRTKLYARLFGSRPAAKISRNRDAPARIEAVAL